MTGPGGLLTGFTSRVLETALDAELTGHLGHEHDQGPARPLGRGRRARPPR